MSYRNGLTGGYEDEKTQTEAKTVATKVVDYSQRPEKQGMPLPVPGSLGRVRVESGVILIADLYNADSAAEAAFEYKSDRAMFGNAPGAKLLRVSLGAMVSGMRNGLYDLMVEQDYVDGGTVVLRLQPSAES